MIILDENIIDSQYKLLTKWRIRVQQIGRDFGRKGMQDEDDVIPLLQSLRHAVLFTCDLGLFKRELCHSRYAIVCLQIPDSEVATYVKRFLRHYEFDTNAKRMGKVVRLSPKKIQCWSVKKETESEVPWKTDKP